MSMPAPAASATTAAHDHLGLTGPLLAAWAPGRVNLIGEHTDYNDGFVLPIAIERVVALAGTVTKDPTDRTVTLYSVRYKEKATFSLDRPPTDQDRQDVPLWARYIAGAVGELQDNGVALQGFQAAIDGDVPAGGGMSSSAALLVATLTWLDSAFHLHKEPFDLAKIGQRAETRGSGVRVGILDQAASVLGKPGQAVLIDCRSFDFRHIPFTFDDTAIILCETGVERSLASSGYNERRAQCETAVQQMAKAIADEGDTRSIVALRDVTQRDLQRLGGHVDEIPLRRARHVITENWRTLAAVEALEKNDLRWFGDLVLASHASLRDDYAVSCPELDAVVEIATAIPGVAGARLVGAGFGGSALILAPNRLAPQVVAQLESAYPARTGKTPTITTLTPAGGPGTTTING